MDTLQYVQRSAFLWKTGQCLMLAVQWGSRQQPHNYRQLRERERERKRGIQRGNETAHCAPVDSSAALLNPVQLFPVWTVKRRAGQRGAAGKVRCVPVGSGWLGYTHSSHNAHMWAAVHLHCPTVSWRRQELRLNQSSSTPAPLRSRTCTDPATHKNKR